MLSMTGGVVGVFLGALLSYVLSHAFSWQTVVLPGSVALSFGFSAMVASSSACTLPTRPRF